MNNSDEAMLKRYLGRTLTSAELAQFLGVDVKTIRLYYPLLGGIRLGRRILFFEKEVIDAIQKRAKMGGPSEIERQEEGKGLPQQEGSHSLGKPGKAKTRADLAREDRHGIIV
jgi:hypothetical protein